MLTAFYRLYFATSLTYIFILFSFLKLITPRQEVINFLLLGHIQNNKEDTETYLHDLGVNIGYKLTYILTTRRETNLILLLQKLAFEFLPELYQTKRRLTRNESCYVLFEDFSPFNEYNSNGSFCVDSFVAGIIEAFMLSNGYKSSVTAYDNDGEGTVYTIKLLDDANEKSD